MSSDSWLSLTDSPFNCCCKCPTAWGKSRAGMNQSWSSSSSISWKQRSKKSCSCSSSSTYQQRGKTKRNYSRGWSSGVPSTSLQRSSLRTMAGKLMRNVPNWFMFINIWSLVGDAVQGHHRTFMRSSPEEESMSVGAGFEIYECTPFCFYFFLSASNLR